MYKILGADHREYGPVTRDQMAQWIKEGRANAATLVQAEGATEWKPLATYAEFSEFLAGHPTSAPPPIAPEPPLPAGSPDQILQRDYRLEVGECISRGYNLLKDNFGLVFGATILFCIIEFIIVAFSAIPILGAVFSLVNIVVVGPLLAGLYMILLRRIRGEHAEVGDLFSGFKDRMGQLILANLIPGLLTGVAAIPGLILIGVGAALVERHVGVAGVPLIAVGGVLILATSIYLGLSWAFTLPLVFDQRFDFWQAMEVSRKMVTRHFGSVLLLVILTGLLNVAGVIACGIGVLFTIPIGFGALMYAYQTIFVQRPAIPATSAGAQV